MTEIQKTQQKPIVQTKKTVAELIEANRAELAKALPAHLDIDRMTKLILYCFDTTPDLLKCSQVSLFAAVRQLVDLGLEPGGARGLAYLIPFGTTCQLIIGYKGFILLAKRAGADIEARIVYENEYNGKSGAFELEFGLAPKLRHRPSLTNPGAPVAAYCLIRLGNGNTHVEFMPWAEVMKIKARSKTSNSGPWVTDTEEMARKTVIRRAVKQIELSPQLAEAVTLLDHEEREVAGETIRAPNLAAVPSPEAEVVAEPAVTEVTA